MALPRVPSDLTLAPVAVALDERLAELRDRSTAEIVTYLELELGRPEMTGSPDDRSARVLEAALRNENLHGWEALITDDHARLRLVGGSVTLDLGLSTSIHDFIDGASKAAPPSVADVVVEDDVAVDDRIHSNLEGEHQLDRCDLLHDAPSHRARRSGERDSWCAPSRAGREC